MAAVDLKNLIGRLNTFSKRALETAAGICVSRTNYEVTVEHVFQAMLEDPSADVQHILNHYEIEHGRVMKALVANLDDLRTGNAGRPVFSPVLMEWIKQAWLIASLEYSLAEVRSGNLLQALVSSPGRLASGDYIDLITDKVKLDDLRENYANIVVNSREEAAFATAGPSGGGGAPGQQAGAEGSAIAKFCVHFTGRAREGLIDPIFGRDREIRQVIDILARRRKNNPIAVGEAGVGKTALVEGLAIRIAEGDVPKLLQGVELYGLDMGALQAGASVKGEFEKRLKAVIEEVKASEKPIIMFIDEAHTLIGAGGAAGSGDAANLLKPALARGELRTIAATTWSEYKKYFEKDPALARRFQLVKVEEPNDEQTTTMLRGLKDKYEAAHGVIIRDDALQAAAELGSRYIAGRQQPDKGVDLMDTASARVKIALTAKPAALDDKERRIATLEREQHAHERDKEHGSTDRDERLAEIAEEIRSLQDQVEADTAAWLKEQEAAQAVVALRQRMAKARLGQAPEGADAPEDPAAIQPDLDAALAALAEIQGEEPMVPIEVDADVVASVISDWTGIPMSNMVQDEAAALLAFEETMKQRIKGQDHVMDIVGTGIRSAKAGLKAPEIPMGIFLFVGPSGVGKTETALGVADLLFGGERFMTSIAMSEFQEKHTVAKLIGSPPGYVGYGEGGLLTEAVRQRPYSVVLLDECEKADPEVMNLFYQVFDKGVLTDGEGIEVDFKDTVIFITSNLATDIITEAGMLDEPPSVDDLVAMIRPVLSAHFKPALVARMTIVPYYPLKQDALREITELKLNKVRKRLHHAHKMKMEWSDEVVDAIASRCTEVETGARNVDHIIRGTLLPRMSTQLLHQMTTGEDMPGLLKVSYTDADGFGFDFE